MSRLQNKMLPGYCNRLLQPGSGCPPEGWKEGQDSVSLHCSPEPCQVVQVTMKSLCAKLNCLHGAQCRNYLVKIGQQCYAGIWSNKVFLFLCKPVILTFEITFFMAFHIGCLCGIPVWGASLCIWEFRTENPCAQRAAWGQSRSGVFFMLGFPQ